MEDALGTHSPRISSQSAEILQTVERASERFASSPTARLRRRVLLAFFAALSTLLVLSLPFSLTLAAAWLGLIALTPAAYFVLTGLAQRTYLFEKTRQFALTARLNDWLTAAAGGLLLAVVLWLLGLLGTAISVGLLSCGLAAGLYFYFDRKVAAERQPALADMHTLIKTLRTEGHDEQAVRQLVARHSGDSWEEFFEANFGYEAKLTARDAWGKDEQGRPRKKFRAWRDVLVRAIDDRVRKVHEKRDRQLLQEAEERDPRTRELVQGAVGRGARRVAQPLVEDAAERGRDVAGSQPTGADPSVEAMQKRARIKAMLAEARGGRSEPEPREPPRNLLAPLGWFFGPRARFLTGGLLLVGCMLWANQNGLLTREHAEMIQSAVTQGVESRSAEQVSENLKANLTAETSPLRVPLLGEWFTTINPGVAGLVLIFSALFRGLKMTLFALPAAAVMVAAPVLGWPDVPVLPLSHALGLAVGLAIAVVGGFFGRTYD